MAAEGEEGSTDLGLNTLFRGIDILIDFFHAMLEKAKEEIARTGKLENQGNRSKGIYGFIISSGLGGLPGVEPFGNLRETPDRPVVAEVREPIVDVFDEDDQVLVMAELPGIEEREVKLAVQAELLIIEAVSDDNNRGYAKEVLLPCPVDIASVSWVHKSGILEVTLPKLGE